jgi:hypothetical protein
MLLLTQNADTQRSYYQVLDISPDELDPKVIEEAALRCYGDLRPYQLTRESECTLRMNEIARALSTLLDPVRRREYDLSLATPHGPAPSRRQPPGKRNTTLAPPVECDPIPDKKHEAIRARGGEQKACDVRVVYRSRAR